MRKHLQMSQAAPAVRPAALFTMFVCYLPYSSSLRITSLIIMKKSTKESGHRPCFASHTHWPESRGRRRKIAVDRGLALSDMNRGIPPLKTRPTFRSALLAGAVALSVIPVAHATSLMGTGYSAVGSEPVSVTAPGASTGAGSFVGFWNGLPITFWCFELTQYFSFNVEYMDYTESPAGNPDLARLFEEVGGPAGATSSLTNSAAFQLAVWEIRYETTTLPNYNLTAGTPTSGNFFATSADPAAVAQANTWLQNLPLTSSYTVSLLHSDNEQDFVYATRPPLRQNLPEPSPLPLLGLGAAAMMFSIRRRAPISHY